MRILSQERSPGGLNLEADARDVAVESLALLARNLELERRRLARAIATSEGSGLYRGKSRSCQRGTILYVNAGRIFCKLTPHGLPPCTSEMLVSWPKTVL
jgi:hypothetical protein